MFSIAGWGVGGLDEGRTLPSERGVTRVKGGKEGGKRSTGG